MAIDLIKDITLETFAHRWLGNAITNGKNTELPDLTTLPIIYDEARAIVCGTGPSLNDDFDKLFIHDIGLNDIIIANHSNLATLLYKGINPSIVVIADSGDATYLRLERDIMPNFKRTLRELQTQFILPTHTRPDTLKLLQDNGFHPYFFSSVIREVPDDRLSYLYTKLYNEALHYANPTVTTMILQSGSVSNMSVLVCFALKQAGKAPNLSKVLLSGVDYSYPNNITRCMQVTWNAAVNDFDIDEKPTFIGPEIPLVKYNGLLTSEDQVAYYKDLRFINLNLKNQDGTKPFEIKTTSHNFISDFLEVEAL